MAPFSRSVPRATSCAIGNQRTDMSRWWEHRRARFEARSSTDPDGRAFPRRGETSRHTAVRRQRLHGHAGATPVAGTNLSRRGGDSIRNRSRTCRGQPHEGANPFVATIFRPAGVKARISTATAPKPRLFVGAIPTPGTIVPWLESVYTTASKSVARKGVWARIPPGRPFQSPPGAIADARVLETRARSGHTGATPVAATIAV